MTRIPHLRIVVAASLVAAGGYALVSLYVLLMTADAALKGDVVGTWKSIAVAAFSFWMGSSSAGKAQGATDVVVTNSDEDPVPTKEPKK